MGTRRTSTWLAGLAGSLAVISLGVLPATAGGAAAAVSPRKAPPAGKQLAVLNGTGDDRYFGVEVAMSGTTAVVGDGVSGGTNLGRAYVFSHGKSGWKQAAELKEAKAGVDGFGSVVAISGTTVVIGAPDAVDFDGEAFVYAKTAAGWKRTAVLKEPDPVFEGDDAFGSSVAVSGTTIIIGAPGHEHGTGFGEAYVFAKTSTGWKQTAELSEAGASDNGFGGAVGIAGTTAVVGAPDAETFAGRAFVFAQTAGKWKQTAQLKGAPGGSGGGGSGALFGHAVAISGTTVTVGEPQRNPSLVGRVYVFVRTAGAWPQQGAGLKDGPAITELGRWLGVSGNTLVVNRSETGAFIFTRKAGRWKAVATVKHAGDEGSAVAVAGSAAIVGAVGTTGPGHAYVYQA
jgi:FG-GAP repeat